MAEQLVGWCALCKSRCGATYTIENGRLTGAGPAPEHPTGKSLCIKGKAAPEILYHPDRLLYPLKRTNPKTADDPGWVRISWEEAIGTVGQKLRAIRAEHGAEAVCYSTTTPSGTALSDGDDWIDRLIRLSGSPNWISSTEVCNWHKDSSHAFTIGTAIPYPDYENTEMIVFWGFNPTSVWLDQATQAAAARARGAKMLVVDPRRFGFAMGADHWLRVRPGADGFLAMGMMRRMFETGAFDTRFLRRWTNAALLVREDDGQFLRARDVDSSQEADAFVAVGDDGALVYVKRNSAVEGDKLLEARLSASIELETSTGRIHCTTSLDRLRQAFEAKTLDEVAEITWIPVEQIIAAADALGSAKSATYYTWTGLGQHAESTQIDRAFATLMSLKGGFDAMGGNLVLPGHPTNKVAGPQLLAAEQLAKAIGMNERPLGPPSVGRIVAHDFYDAVLNSDPYQPKALVGFGSNLTVAHANSARGREAMRALDFYVHCDIFENPTARFADILLPVNSPWERDAMRVGFGSGLKAEQHIQYRHKMVEPIGESRSDAEIVFAIANELGLRDQFFGGDIDAARSYILEPLGVTLEQLKENPEGISLPLKQRYKKYAEVGDGKVNGFNTETGLVELYSALLVRFQQPGVPEFDIGILPSNEEFPFALTTAKAGYFCHSQHRQVPSLRKREPDPSVSLSPEAAEGLGIEEGDWVDIQNHDGSIRMRAKIDKTLHPRVVRASYGWWKQSEHEGLSSYDPYRSGGSNYNILVDAKRLDPMSGTAGLRSQSCNVVPVKARNPNGWRGFRPMRIRQIRRVADEVTMVTFEGLDGATLPDYEPGQHITVSLRPDGSETEIIRCYSLIGLARQEDRKTFSVAVRFVPAPHDRPEFPDGKMSEIMNRRVTVGDRVDVKAPGGDFVIPAISRRPIVMVAGGIGITPFMSYLETVAAAGASHRIHLVYANRSQSTEAFADRIAEFRARIPTLTASRHWGATEGPLPDDVVTTRISIENLLRPDFEEAPAIYFCGPAPMTKALRQALKDAGHPPSLVFEETFAPAQVDQNSLPTGEYAVVFSKSGKTLTWSREKGSILELAESAGIKITNGCRAGQCESCEVKILHGECLHRVHVSHPGGDTCLACQAVPTGDVTIEA
ncbi:molybdopterin oxidoreductase [Caballeronia udeis]|uniref:Molybdopterin oxidoreductase n=1 Tax=Caballeronia udeis TaxID=1232866 RepID=A0A158IB30_9BURK|nr:molybdopterin-dependent oxidoreductase [Caballeronia udeis]SAL53778.1 molybdopterin oxidoreductase [Caballeronia udeis]